MRIVHLLNAINDSGDGISNVAVDLACDQAARGHHVMLISTGGTLEHLLHKTGVETARVNLTRRTPFGIAASVIQLRRIVTEFTPDVIHVHTMTAALLARFAKPTVRLVATVHNEYQPGVSLMRVADVVVGNSQAVSAAMVKRGVRRGKVRTVLNGVGGSLRRSTVRVEKSPLVDEKTIVALGAVSRRKGADVLLDAFAEVDARVRGAKLLFVGHIDWPEVTTPHEFKDYMKNVQFLGYDSQPEKYLGFGTVFAIPSRKDPFPLALLEARLAGCAIVGTAVDGIPEALDEGEAGLLVPAEDPLALAQALVSILQDSELRHRLASAAQKGAARYTVARMSEDYLKLYGR